MTRYAIGRPGEPITFVDHEGPALPFLQTQCGGYVDVLCCGGDIDIWVGEEAKLQRQPINPHATVFAYDAGAIGPDDYLAGTVVYATSNKRGEIESAPLDIPMYVSDAAHRHIQTLAILMVRCDIERAMQGGTK